MSRHHGRFINHCMNGDYSQYLLYKFEIKFKLIKIETFIVISQIRNNKMIFYMIFIGLYTTSNNTSIRNHLVLILDDILSRLFHLNLCNSKTQNVCFFFP